jgi:hypothetical protein
MTERDKLIARLINLKNNKSRDITIGIDYLLSVLNQPAANQIPVKPTVHNKSIEVDGGQFNDSIDT